MVKSIVSGAYRTYRSHWQHWCLFVVELDLPFIFLDEYIPQDVGLIMSWFAIACATRGNNKQGKGNIERTYKGKKSAIIYFHRLLRDHTPVLTGATLVLIERAYKKMQSSTPHPMHAFTASMLRAARAHFSIETVWGELGFNCMVVSYFYLCRGGEMWLYAGKKPPAYDGSNVQWTAAELDELADLADHRVQYDEVRLYDAAGIELFAPHFGSAEYVTIKFLHSKADQIGRGDVIRHKRSGCPILCPVLAAARAKTARWSLHQSNGLALGGALSAGIKAQRIGAIIKSVAKSFRKNPSDYALHSIRIGGATAMFSAGLDSLVIKLAGRWSSWCVELYTRIGEGAMDHAAKAIVASSL